MAKEETSADRSELGEVQITVVVVPGWVRATLTRLLATPRVLAGLVAVGVIAAVTVGAIISVSWSSGRAGRPMISDALATQFGLRSNCVRLTVVSPDGDYARIDLDRAGPCGMFGNQVTLILHRLHGLWQREFEASSWTCPINRIPQRLATELRLCYSKPSTTSTGSATSNIALRH